MIAFILLYGKEFSLSDGTSAAIIGIFIGVICGLFYYQHYAKPYFWVFSIGGGLLFTLISDSLFARLRSVDNYIGVAATIASFAIPFLLTLALNYGLRLVKQKKRKRQKVQQKNTDVPVDIFSGAKALPTPTDAIKPS